MRVKRIIVNAEHNPKLSYAFDGFQARNKARNLSIATIKGYKETFDRFTALCMDEMKCDEIGRKTVDAFVTALMDDGIKASSINHYLRNMRSFLYWCMDEGYVQRFKIPLQKEQESIKETYSDEEIRLLIREPVKHASFVEWRSWAMVCWFLSTGNRAETACNIKIGDLYFQENEIYINKAKTKKAMILPMGNELKQVLRKYISQFRHESTDDEYLFCNVGNQRLTVNALQCGIRSYNKSRGVEITGIHAFRHTFAKNWIRNNGDVFRLQKILGHKSLEMTRRYVNLFSDDLKKDFERYCPLERIKSGGNAKRLINRS